MSLRRWFAVAARFRSVARVFAIALRSVSFDFSGPSFRLAGPSVGLRASASFVFRVFVCSVRPFGIVSFVSPRSRSFAPSSCMSASVGRSSRALEFRAGSSFRSSFRLCRSPVRPRLVRFASFSFVRPIVVVHVRLGRSSSRALEFRAGSSFRSRGRGSPAQVLPIHWRVRAGSPQRDVRWHAQWRVGYSRAEILA